MNDTAGLLARWQELLQRWVRPAHTSGVLVLLDHGLFSGTHFVVNVLLARWITAEEFGAFTAAYSLFLLLATFHNALLVEPMLVFGAGKYAQDLKKYLGSILKLHLLIGGAVATILVLIASIFWWYEAKPLDAAVAGLALASPLILLVWLLRRAFYASMLPQWSVVGGAAYLLLVSLGMYTGYSIGFLRPGSAFAIMAAAALLTGCLLAAKLRPQWEPSEATRMAAVITDCREYGSWAVAVSLAVWLLNNVAYLGLAVFGSLADTGALRALLNLAMPFQHFVIASATFLLPQMAASYHRSDSPAASAAGERARSLLLVAATMYSLLMLLLGNKASAIIYSGKYTFTQSQLGAAAMLPLLWAFAAFYSVILKARQNPRSVLVAYLAGAVLALGTMVPLIVWRGMFGALAGWVLSMFTASIALWLVHRQVSRRAVNEGG